MSNFFCKKAMSFNSSRSLGISCYTLVTSVSAKGSVLYQVVLATSIANLLLGPLAVAANALILGAIWRNPSLRTPSYVLLAGLAFSDFCTGLITQPFDAARRITDQVINQNRNSMSAIVSGSVAYFFASLTVFVMTLMAVERWLYMSRRSILTVRRVVTIFTTFALLAFPMQAWGLYTRLHHKKVFGILATIFFSFGGFLVCLTVIAYFKVFLIIRRHQNQVQTLQNTIAIKKYRKSCFTILYVLAVFVLCYTPYGCVFVTFHALELCGESYRSVFQVCGALVFLSSLLNPLLYYWRMKEIKHGVNLIVGKILCKPRNEQ